MLRGIPAGRREPVAARHDEQHVRVRVGQILLRRLDGSPLRLARHALAARQIDHLRHPVTRYEERIEPLQSQDTWARRSGHGPGDLVRALPQIPDHDLGSLRRSGRLTDQRHALQHVAYGMRIQREHIRFDLRRSSRLPSALGRNGAHLAHGLRQDEVGRELSELVDVDLVEVAPGRSAFADRLIDRSAALAGEIEGRLADPWAVERLGWVVTLVGDADELVLQTELAEDLGRGGEERDDLHARLSKSACSRRPPQPRPGSRPSG